MVYLIDPHQVYSGRCKSVAYPLYGIPCYGYCRTYCVTVCSLLL